MCLKTHEVKPMIAIEDIPVWKVLKTDNHGYYQDEYVYHHGKNYPSGVPDVESIGFGKYAVGGGYLHAFSRRWSHQRNSKVRKSWIRHTFKNAKIVKMYIPKGTWYYRSTDGYEVCAKCLVWPWISFK